MPQVSLFSILSGAEYMFGLIFHDIFMTSVPLIPLLVFFLILLVLAWNDIRHDRLPDKLTFGGSICGLIVSATFPQIHSQTTATGGFLMSLTGAISGYLFGWACCEIGKYFFGKKTINYPLGCEFSITPIEGGYNVKVGDDVINSGDIFSRYSDRLYFDTSSILLETTKPIESSEVRNITLSYDTLYLDQYSLPLTSVKAASGICTSLRFPREVMGFGLVKTLSFIGAFLGWKGGAIVFSGSLILCTIVSLLFALSTRWAAQPSKLQLSPYLLISSLLYIVLSYRLAF
jgi:prepilin signal peptidase PulO-like enzyme (type II secretory pathway)